MRSTDRIILMCATNTVTNSSSTGGHLQGLFGGAACCAAAGAWGAGGVAHCASLCAQCDRPASPDEASSSKADTVVPDAVWLLGERLMGYFSI